MLKIVTLACAVFGMLCAVSIESWLRRHTGDKEVASYVYLATIEKYSEFWIAQIAPVLILLGVVGAFVGFGIGLYPAIAFAAGGLTSFISVYIGSRSFTSSVVSSSSYLFDGEIKTGLKSSFRGASVIGLTLVFLGVSALSVLFFLFQNKQLMSVAAAFALGASIAGVGIRLSGAVLTSAHKLSDSEEYNVDYIGAFASNGAEFILLLLVSACSAALLADIGVESSGVTSTFTAASAAKYPVVVLACGLAASALAVFLYRPYTGKYSHFGITAGNIVAGIISFGASVYFSIRILESPVYGYCVGLGILAQLISAEFCKNYSMDSSIFKRNLPRSSDEDIDIPMLNGLSVGFMTSLVSGVLTMVALIMSFYIANYYGVALAAIGTNSIAAVNLAVRNFATALSASSSFASYFDEAAEENAGYYKVLHRISAKAKSAGRSYISITEALTLISLLTAFTFTAGNLNVVLSDPLVFGGMIFGTVFIIFLLGLLIRTILLSTRVMLEAGAEDSDEYRNINSVRGISFLCILALIMPLIIGFVLGTYSVTGFLAGSIVTGVALILAFNNTGRYYDRITTDALGSVLIIMTAITLAAVPAFIKFGAVFF